jgi:hypothetical protein
MTGRAYIGGHGRVTKAFMENTANISQGETVSSLPTNNFHDEDRRHYTMNSTMNPTKPSKLPRRPSLTPTVSTGEGSSSTDDFQWTLSPSECKRHPDLYLVSPHRALQISPQLDSRRIPQTEVPRRAPKSEVGLMENKAPRTPLPTSHRRSLRNLFSTIDGESDAREPILCQSGGTGPTSNRTQTGTATRYGMFKKQGSIGNLTRSFKDLLSPQQGSGSPGKRTVRIQAHNLKPPLSAKGGQSRAALDGSKAKSCRALFLSPNGNRIKYANLDTATCDMGLGPGAILAPDLDGSGDMENEFDHSEADPE